MTRAVRPARSDVRILLVAIVIDDGRLLIARRHDAGIWRLPTAHWPTGRNPNQVLRHLVATTAGAVISPVLHTSARVAPEVAVLVFTASPIVRRPPLHAHTVRWLPLDQAATALPAIDASLVRLVLHHAPSGRTLMATDAGVSGAAHR